MKIKYFFIIAVLHTPYCYNFDNRWRRQSNQLGQQIYNQAQQLRFHYGIEPYQQWILSSLGTLLPTALWYTGTISGKKAACLALATIATAYFAGAPDCNAVDTGQILYNEQDAQAHFKQLKEHYDLFNGTIIRRDYTPIQTLLNAMTSDIRSIIPFIQYPPYQKFANMLLIKLITAQQKSSEKMLTIQEVQKLSAQIALFLDLFAL